MRSLIAAETISGVSGRQDSTSHRERDELNRSANSLNLILLYSGKKNREKCPIPYYGTLCIGHIISKSRIRNSCSTVLVMGCEVHGTTHGVFRDARMKLLILVGLSNHKSKNPPNLPWLKLSILPVTQKLATTESSTLLEIL